MQNLVWRLPQNPSRFSCEKGSKWNEKGLRDMPNIFLPNSVPTIFFITENTNVFIKLNFKWFQYFPLLETRESDN